MYQTTKKRASGPKCPVTGKRIQGVCRLFRAMTCFHDFFILIFFVFLCCDYGFCYCFSRSRSVCEMAFTYKGEPFIQITHYCLLHMVSWYQIVLSNGL